jgi:hypothetical protein
MHLSGFVANKIGTDENYWFKRVSNIVVEKISTEVRRL